MPTTIQTAVIAAVRQHHQRIDPLEVAVDAAHVACLAVEDKGRKPRARAEAALIRAQQDYHDTFTALRDHDHALHLLCSEHRVTWAAEPQVMS